MKKALVLFPVLALILAQNSEAVTRYNSIDYSKYGVRVTLADPSGSVYQKGETVSFTVDTDTEAHILVFNIDTEGFVSLLYPRQSTSFPKLSAGETLEIPQDARESLRVSGMTGIEFVFALAVPERNAISERQVASLLEGERLPFHKRFRIDGDPFLAANRVAEKLVRGVGYDEGVSLAYTYFYVNEAVDYPRYLCEECFASGKDPYGEGMAQYEATTAFNNEYHLSYPLAPAFERQFIDNLARPEGYDDGDDETSESTTNRVYVSYYSDYSGYGSYPWYAGYGYYPYYDYYSYYPYYYGSGFYWSVGFYWGHHYDNHYGYPYYNGGYGYGYPYYDGGYGYGYPYYNGGYGYGGRYGETIAARSLRLKGSVRYKSGVASATNYGNNPRVRHKATTRTTRAINKSTKVKHSSRAKSYSKKAVKKGDRTRTRPVKKIARRAGSRSHKERVHSSKRSHRSKSRVGRSKATRSGGRKAIKRSTTRRYSKASPRSGRSGKSRSVKTHRRSNSSNGKGRSVKSSRSHSRSSKSSSRSSSRGGRSKKSRKR